MVKINKKKFKAALLDSGGIITTIANRLGVARISVYDYLNRFPKFKKDLEDEKEKILDLAELSLFSQIKARDFGATKYLLSTLGKRRGYVEKQEISHSTDTPLIIEEHVYDGKSKDTIDKQAKGSAKLPQTKG